MDNSLFMENFIYVVGIIAAILLFLFVVGIIVAIKFATYTQSPDRRKGGSDQRNSSDGSEMAEFGSGYYRAGYTYGEGFEGVDEVIVSVFPNLPPVARFIISEIVIFILVVVGFVAFKYFLFS